MATLITNEESEQLIDMSAAIRAIEDGFTQIANNNATYQRRVDIWSPTAKDGDFYRFGIQMGAIRDPPRLALRFKSTILTWEVHDGKVVERKHNVEPGKYMGFILLFDTSTGALIGLLNDGVIQHLRTSATAGVACDHLANDEASSLGILGSGGMAEGYAEAFSIVRDLEQITVFSPTKRNRMAFAETMGEKLDTDVTAVDSPEAAVNGVDIVATCTNAREPVLDPAWIGDGQFIINVSPVEIGPAMYDRADKVFTTTNRQITDNTFGTEDEINTRPERYGKSVYRRTEYPTIIDLLAGTTPGRTTRDEVILYNNTAIGGIQFVALSTVIHEGAEERKLGTEVPLDWFQQTIIN